MDDFGTGYSSLSYLKSLPFDILKVDQSFVHDITNDPDSATIAKTVIAMARSLQLKVVAEGVETEGQLTYLRSHSCDEMQGYYFSRPVPAQEFESLMREGRCLSFASDHADVPGKTILVVDDDEDVALSLKEMLLLDGYHVLTAGSAAEGFELLARNRVSIVVSDLWMPVMNGSEFLRRVRQIYPDTVRIMVSGYADLASVTEAVNQGAIYKFVSKPWDYHTMRERISDAFMYHESLSGKGEHLVGRS
jgi:CheY-like chemotaxis protein